MNESIRDLTDQEVDIVKLILNSGVIHYSDISNYIGRSRKTISKYLDNIERVASGYGTILIRKRNVGIYFEGSTNELQDAIKEGAYSHTKGTGKERLILILSKLLLSNEPQTIQALADSAFVSRSTLEKDFKQVKKMLARLGATIITNRDGMLINASERSKRKLMAELLTMYWGEAEYSEDKLGEIQRQVAIPPDLKTYFSQVTVDKVLDSLKEFEKQSLIRFTDYEYQSLAIHLVIAMERIQEDQPLGGDESTQKLDPNTTKLIELLEHNFGFPIPRNESEYINIHILAAEGKPLESEESAKPSSELQENSVSAFLKSNLANYDESLLQGLMVHLVSALKRLDLGLNLHNPYTQDIKTFFPLAFNNAMDLGESIESFFNIKLNDDEIAFIALHIETFIERNKSVVNTVIVCSTGLGTARLLEQRIRDYFPDTIQINRITSIQDLIKKPINEDLVISTINIKIPNKPVIVVSPFLDKKSSDKIRQVSDEILSEREDSTSFGKLLSEKIIFIEHESETKQEVIEKISEALVSQKFGRQGIASAAIKREAMASTSMGNVAMPHAPIEFVIRPCIAVYINPDGITWDDEPVNVVFFLAMNMEVQPEIEQIYKHFNKVLENKMLIKKITNSTTKNEVLSLLRGDLIE